MKTALFCSILAIFLLIAAVPTNTAFAEEEGSLEIFVTLQSGLRASPTEMMVKIYQDFEEEPFQEIEITSNPFLVSSLPVDHSYQIEVYTHSIYAAYDIVKMEQLHQQLEIVIPGTGGLDIVVLYNDKITPIQDASIEIFAFDDNLFKKTSTYLYGEAPRLYLPITTQISDYYYIDIKLTDNITKRISPVTINKGNFELKVVTDWPPMVEELFTVKIFESFNSKFRDHQGHFVEMVQKDGEVIKKSNVTPQGEANFSNFNVNDYDLILKKSIGSETQEIVRMSVSLTGEIDSVKMVLDDLKQTPISVPFDDEETPEETPKETGNCNCVAFRLSNVQDYYLNDVQTSLIDLFDSKDAGLTIGVFGGSIGDDSKIVDQVNEKLSKGNLLVANLGWELIDLTSLSEQEQNESIGNSKAKILDVFGIHSTTFIAPYSKFNDDTIKAIQANGMKYLSSSASSDPVRDNFQNSIPSHIPYTLAIKNMIISEPVEDKKTVGEQAQMVLDDLDEYGFAVVNIQSQDFAQNDGKYQNLVDLGKLSDLDFLLGSLQNRGIDIVTLDKIPELVTPKKIPSWVDELESMYQKGQISHDDLTTAIDYLVFKKIAQIEDYSVSWN